MRKEEGSQRRATGRLEKAELVETGEKGERIACHVVVQLSKWAEGRKEGGKKEGTKTAGA